MDNKKEVFQQDLSKEDMMRKVFKKLIILTVMTAMAFVILSCSAHNAVSPDSAKNAYITEQYSDIATEHNTEEYNSITENAYKSVADYPLSTFSADVDTASYSNIRRMINNGQTVDTGAV